MDLYLNISCGELFKKIDVIYFKIDSFFSRVWFAAKLGGKCRRGHVPFPPQTRHVRCPDHVVRLFQPMSLHGRAVLTTSPQFTPGFTLGVVWGFSWGRKSPILTITDQTEPRNVSKQRNNRNTRKFSWRRNHVFTSPGASERQAGAAHARGWLCPPRGSLVPRGVLGASQGLVPSPLTQGTLRESQIGRLLWTELCPPNSHVGAPTP